jgi:hypothetical protein
LKIITVSSRQKNRCYFSSALEYNPRNLDNSFWMFVDFRRTGFGLLGFDFRNKATSDRLKPVLLNRAHKGDDHGTQDVSKVTRCSLGRIVGLAANVERVSSESQDHARAHLPAAEIKSKL